MNWNALAMDYQNGKIPFNAVYDALVPVLQPVARKFKLFGYDIDDLIQIAMVSIHRNIYRFRNGCFLGFARLIARRRILDLVRVQRIEKAKRDLSLQDQSNIVYLEWATSRELSPCLSACIREETERKAERLCLIESFKKESHGQALRAARQPPEFLRRVVRLNDNHSFDTVIDAALASGIGKLSILNAANHGYTCAKSKWRWA